MLKNFILFICGLLLFSQYAHAQSEDRFSAESSAENVAILIQGNIAEGKNDMAAMKSSLSDPLGNYGFKIASIFNATSGTAYEAIKLGAKKVGPNGTLFLFLSGHGSPNGGAQMNDNHFINYHHVRTAIKESGRDRMRRLVIIVFGCYSGSWIYNIQKAGDAAREIDRGIVDEVLVMTSSASNQLSYFQPGGYSFFVSEFSRAFKGLKNQSSSALIGDLVKRIQSNVKSSSVQYKASPVSLLNEKLF